MKIKNRWIILIASIAVNLCIGSAYAWSIFQNPIIELFGWTTAQVSLAFTINLSIVPIAMIIAGRIQDRIGPKYVSMAGGLIFGAGLILTGEIKSLMSLYVTYGLLGGFGIGTVYACTVSNTMKCFPDKKGMAGGLVAAGFGMGSVIFAPLGVKIMAANGVMATFNTFGILFSILIVAGAFFIDIVEPEVEKSEIMNSDIQHSVSQDKSPKEMLSTLRFYLIWGMYIIGCIGGLMIIGHASPIGQEKIGLSASTAALAVSFIGIANSGGRIVWGSVSDKIGRYNALFLMFGVNAACLMVLSLASNFVSFLIGICGIAMSFGGFLGIMPSVAAENFGTRHIGINYGILFSAFGAAAFIGPRFAAVIKEAGNGDYTLAFVIVAAINIIGMVLSVVSKLMIGKSKVKVA
jgi:OFA family oxalate/formate antiporter-like MFS transporter